jgi:hypothetical protein
VKSTEPFITGFLEDNKYIGRPVDVMQMKDGSLLGLRRLERRGLSRHLRQAEGGGQEVVDRHCERSEAIHLARGLDASRSLPQ